MTLVNRDPFAREEVHREREFCYSSCDWCGSHRQTKGGRKFLFRYRTETDGGRKSEHKGLFCCKSCHDSYHGG